MNVNAAKCLKCGRLFDSQLAVYDCDHQPEPVRPYTTLAEIDTALSTLAWRTVCVENAAEELAVKRIIATAKAGLEDSALLKEVATSGVEFADSRLKYVVVQIDRDTWEAVAKRSGLRSNDGDSPVSRQGDTSGVVAATNPTSPTDDLFSAMMAREHFLERVARFIEGTEPELFEIPSVVASGLRTIGAGKDAASRSPFIQRSPSSGEKE